MGHLPFEKAQELDANNKIGVFIASVILDGRVNSIGYFVGRDNLAIRPALWINCKSLNIIKKQIS